jgi:hypothetical protein
MRRGRDGLFVRRCQPALAPVTASRSSPCSKRPALKENAAAWEFERQGSRGPPRPGWLRRMVLGGPNGKGVRSLKHRAPDPFRPYGGHGKGPTDGSLLPEDTVWCKPRAKNRLDIIVYNQE